MSQLSPKNKNDLRQCVLYEFIDGKPVFEAYKSFCDVIGDSCMDYVDFEFWFMRFANGNLNLDFNFDKSSSLSIFNIPIEILVKIMNELDWVSRLSMRQVSRAFRSIVDEESKMPKSLSFGFYDDTVFLQYDDSCVKYKDLEEEGHDDKIDIALFDFGVTLINPRLKLDYFEVLIDAKHGLDIDSDKCFKSLEALLKARNLPLPVKNVNIETNSGYEMNHAKNIIPYLKSGVLEKIVTNCDSSSFENIEIMKEIVELDQWKQAKHLEIDSLVKIPIENFLHFEHFELFFEHLCFQDVKERLLESSNFRHCTLQVMNSFDLEELAANFGIQYMGDDEGIRQTTFYEISTNSLEMTMFLDFVTFDRKF
ncbi:F-box domain-containing protein [Caenorhabditis elegans]|uniref:F-box domain-containing protein n=1 Tax=Caenorhabditis elegans TaxID=6239 RepID=G5EDK0_CAEEL|nr:F-box domain-containing protein [Caenorhabditis elegans]CAA20972.1 F-box domain-containing protein [Caenorhabditis elegans]|eukprot:NP_507275.1 F-box A protein [Caenorhabditis elegans]